MTEVLLDVRNLKKHFRVGGKILKAVDGVSFSIAKGETFGLIGESGCGKSTLGRTILRLIEPTDGEIYFEGKNILKLKKGEMRKLRKDMQIVFQDPFSSLNPRMTVREIVGRPLKIHGLAKDEQERVEKILGILKDVKLVRESSQEILDKYPDEFSGGQRQRIAIARALILNPKFLVLDEPTSALDVSVQGQILNLLNELKEKFKGTYLFISHDLAISKRMCDRVSVMYLGKILELAPKNKMFENPTHPYTQALLSAVLSLRSRKKRVPLIGEPPSLLNPPEGCKYHPRCPLYLRKKSSLCEKAEPQIKEITNGHFVACHYYEKM